MSKSYHEKSPGEKRGILRRASTIMGLGFYKRFSTKLLKDQKDVIGVTRQSLSRIRTGIALVFLRPPGETIDMRNFDNVMYAWGFTENERPKVMVRYIVSMCLYCIVLATACYPVWFHLSHPRGNMITVGVVGLLMLAFGFRLLVTIWQFWVVWRRCFIGFFSWLKIMLWPPARQNWEIARTQWEAMQSLSDD